MHLSNPKIITKNQSQYAYDSAYYMNKLHGTLYGLIQTDT